MGPLVTPQGGFAACSVYDTLFNLFLFALLLTAGFFHICPNMKNGFRYARSLFLKKENCFILFDFLEYSRIVTSKPSYSAYFTLSTITYFDWFPIHTRMEASFRVILTHGVY